MLFYILFEAVLIPMYLIIGFYGSRERRIRSSYMLFLYTLISSIIMFVSILFIFFNELIITEEKDNQRMLIYLT